MYTGIVQELGRVESVTGQPGYRTFAVACSAGFLDGLEVGASVAVDGTCFTATSVGILEGGAMSKSKGHARVETPHLNVAYKAPRQSQFAQS